MPRRREISGATFQNARHGEFGFTNDDDQLGHRDPTREDLVLARTVAHSETRADTEYAALMECAPGENPMVSLEELSPLRDILGEALDATLTERELWIFNSLTVERLSLRQLADRLGLSKTHCARLRDEIMCKMRLALQDNPTIQEYLR